jgi:isocitrate/isopropylmalate dehydrogenase
LSNKRPTPPADAPEEVGAALDELSREMPRRVTRYAEEIAERRERESG